MLKVSVSGVRGVVYESLTPQIALEFGLAFGTFTKGSKVVIGRDTRTTGELIRNAVICGLASCGSEIIDLGICPTPTVLFAARKFKSNAVIITASHNPSQWNGIKFAKKDGTFLNKNQMKSIFNIYRSKKFSIAASSKKKGSLRKFDRANEIHMDAVIKNIDKNLIRKKRFKVACDFCNGTGAVITKKFLHKLGCRVYTINDEPNGRFAHDPEPKVENLKALSRLTKGKKANLGLAQDPDADRLTLCDERGHLIGEENTLAVIMKAILAKRKGKVVVNLSTSMRMDDIADEFGVKLFKTPVGEINVAEKMKKIGALVGGEGNGGIIYPKINFCRDSLVGIGIVLEYLAKTGKGLSEITGGITQYEMVKGKFHISPKRIKSAMKKVKNKFKNKKLNLSDGIKIIMPTGWMHIRPSNTEPIMRIVAEAKTKKEARRLYNLARGVI